jgi:hypothetical protein
MLFGANNRPRQATHVAFCGNHDRPDDEQRATRPAKQSRCHSYPAARPIEER